MGGDVYCISVKTTVIPFNRKHGDNFRPDVIYLCQLNSPHCRLPLHYACGNQASSSVIRMLLSANPSATKTADPSGMIPIHFAARWGPSSVSVIDMLILTDSSCRQIRASDGLTALDMAKVGDYTERADVISSLSRGAEGRRSRTPMKAKISSSPRGPPSPGAGLPRSRQSPGPVVKFSSSVSVVSHSDSITEATATPTIDPDDRSEEDSLIERRYPPSQTLREEIPTTPIRHSSPYRPPRAGGSPRHNYSPGSGNKTTIQKLVSNLDSVRKELKVEKRDHLDTANRSVAAESRAVEVDKTLSEREAELSEARQMLSCKEREAKEARCEMEDIRAKSKAAVDEVKTELLELMGIVGVNSARQTDFDQQESMLNSEISELSEKLTEQFKEMEKLHVERDEESNQNNLLEIEVVDLNDKLAETESELTSAKEEGEMLKSQVDEIASERDSFIAKSDELTAFNAELTVKVEKAAERNLEVITIRKEVNDLKVKLEDATSSRTSLQTEVINLADKASNLSVILSERDEELTIVRTEMMTIKSELMNSTIQRKTMKIELEDLNGNFNNLKASMEEMKDNRDGAFIKLANREMQLTKLTAEWDNLQGTEENLEVALEAMLEDRDKTVAELAAKEIQLADMVSEWDELQAKVEELATSKEDIGTLQHDLGQAEAQNHELKSKLDVVDGHVIALSSALATLMEKQDSIEVSISEQEDNQEVVVVQKQKGLSELMDLDFKEENSETIAMELNGALESQKSEMETVMNILEAIKATSMEDFIEVEGLEEVEA